MRPSLAAATVLAMMSAVTSWKKKPVQAACRMCGGPMFLCNSCFKASPDGTGKNCKYVNGKGCCKCSFEGVNAVMVAQ